MNIIPEILDVGAGWMEIASKPHSREDDKEIAKALGWRVSKDDWWNVKQDGTIYPVLCSKRTKCETLSASASIKEAMLCAY